MYAVGIGAKAGDIGQIYENDEKFNAFPTYPVVLNFKGDSNDVVDFVEFASKSGGSVPGLPDMDPTRILRESIIIESLILYKFRWRTIL